jgi:phage tail-like protein
MPSTNAPMFSGIPLEYPVLRTDLWSLIFPPEMALSERFEVEAERPKVSNDVKEVKYKNSITKYKGATKFENLNVKFRDVVGPSVMQKLWQWQREHYDPATGCGGYPSQYKKNLTLNMEDDCGNVVQSWTLYGCFLANLDGGGLNMEQSSEIALASLTIAYDSCQLNF